MVLFAGDMEDQVCPVIMDLSSAESMDDYRTEAVAVSSRCRFACFIAHCHAGAHVTTSA